MGGTKRAISANYKPEEMIGFIRNWFLQHKIQHRIIEIEHLFWGAKSDADVIRGRILCRWLLVKHENDISGTTKLYLSNLMKLNFEDCKARFNSMNNHYN